MLGRFLMLATHTQTLMGTVKRETLTEILIKWMLRAALGAVRRPEKSVTP